MPFGVRGTAKLPLSHPSTLSCCPAGLFVWFSISDSSLPSSEIISSLEWLSCSLRLRFTRLFFVMTRPRLSDMLPQLRVAPSTALSASRKLDTPFASIDALVGDAGRSLLGNRGDTPNAGLLTLVVHGEHAALEIFKILNIVIDEIASRFQHASPRAGYVIGLWEFGAVVLEQTSAGNEFLVYFCGRAVVPGNSGVACGVGQEPLSTARCRLSKPGDNDLREWNGDAMSLMKTTECAPEWLGEEL
uniref:Uncharacterized protein n=1 Tax=Anopheles atroparvus TaxID=41427 RepID=A0A182ISC1_ANOAO